jgi:hypothetical protein
MESAEYKKKYLIHTKKLDKRCALKQKYSRGTLIHKIRFQRKSK